MIENVFLKKRSYSWIKECIYTVFDDSYDDRPSRVFKVFIFTLIALNVVAVILETIEPLSTKFLSIFRLFELFSVFVFTIEYLLRLWTCTENQNFSEPVLGRLRFALSPFAVIDLVAILPFYFPFLIILDLRFVRVLRLLRLLRILKLGRYSESMRMIVDVLRNKKEELGIAVFVAFILLIFSSSFMYFIEHEAQPEAFTSIPDAMWWGIATLTTVGYGDIYPVTAIGKLLGAFIALLGVGLFALPAGILGSGFVEEMRKKRAGESVCPHCGNEIREWVQ